MNEWNIQSRAHACEACGQPFADKQPYHTLLFDQPPELRRSDICDACAHKDADARSRAGFISHWQGIYEAPAPVVDAIQKENAETILRKLIEQNDPSHAPAAFILAVMLERKRILKVKEQLTRDGQRVFIRPAETTLFHQVLAYLQSKPDPVTRLPGTIAGREGVAAAAATLRWGSYLAVLLDHGKPVWDEAGTAGISRISDGEMARIVLFRRSLPV